MSQQLSVLPNTSTSVEDTDSFYPVCYQQGTLEDASGSFLDHLSHSYAEAHGYLASTVCTFGIVANAMNILVLTRPRIRSPTFHILTCLAVADFVTMLVYLPHLIHFFILRGGGGPLPPLHTRSYGWITYSQASVSVTVISHSAAIWLTVLLAVYRYCIIRPGGPATATVASAAGGRSLQQAWRYCYLSTTAVCLASVISTLPNILVNKVAGCRVLSSTNHTLMIAYYIDFDNASILFQVNFLWQSVVIKMLPCCILAIFTTLLVREVRRAKQRRKTLRASQLCSKNGNTSSEQHGHGNSGRSLQIWFRRLSSSFRDGRRVGNVAMRDLRSAHPTATEALLQPLEITESSSSLSPPIRAMRNVPRPNTALNAREVKDTRTTIMLIIIVLCFIITELPQGVCNVLILTWSEFYKNVYEKLGEFIDFLTLCNQSVTFILYASMSTDFQHTFLQLFCPIRLRRSVFPLAHGKATRHHQDTNHTMLTHPTQQMLRRKSDVQVTPTRLATSAEDNV